MGDNGRKDKSKRGQQEKLKQEQKSKRNRIKK